MPTNLAAALAFARENQTRFLSELIEFVSIPSVSTDPAAKPAMQHAAQWVAGQLKSLGMENVQVLPTGGHPVVYGEYLKAGVDKPTVLIYGHYDVQPAEPLELWLSPAFSPEQRGENLYGRGASDMKGQVMATLKASEALVRTGDLPLNLKWLIEGEEEIGSPNLGAFIAGHKELLACDFAINPDTGMIAPDVPTITYGLRGLAYFELRVSGPAHDLHSGVFGGSVHNPAQALCELIAGMHDSQGRITLPGFYDSVLPMEEAERRELERLPNDDAFYLEQTGAPKLYGETGYTAVERVGGRPTLEVNGLLSGFTGEGSKTVLPAKAMAKISMRLVPNQDPMEVEQQLRRYLKQNAPETIRWELLSFSKAPASVGNLQMPAVKALAQALEETWGKLPVYKREGGSVPVVSQMKELLGVESVMTGFGLPDDNLHAPNEKIHLPTYFKGIEVFIRYLSILGEG
jgi:acetylornithine deacetylase/succinyl-diaminopimelate desuccinylase-like protein